MATPEPQQEPVQTQAGRVLCCVLAMTRRLMAGLLVGFLVVCFTFAIGLLSLGTEETESSSLRIASAVIYYIGLTMFGVGVECGLWNLQSDICVRVLREGWLATVKSYVCGSGLWAGHYAWQHCEELASWLMGRPHRLPLFLLPHVLLWVWTVVALVMPPEWPFE